MTSQNKNSSQHNLPGYFMIFILLCGSLLLSNCNEQARGFAFPEGNIEEGKATFERLACNECHTVSGVEWKGSDDNLKVHLGGAVTTLKSYGELVTSIINPSHKIAKSHKYYTTGEGDSKMKNYNEVMTVQELIDVVSFLQSEYDLESPQTNYRYYY